VNAVRKVNELADDRLELTTRGTLTADARLRTRDAALPACSTEPEATA
jgi:hypothetical protein